MTLQSWLENKMNTDDSKEGEELYKRTFWKKEEIKDFLIGGFDGVVK